MPRPKISGLRWYGGKSIHLPFILPLLPRAPVFVEPYGGSAAVLLNRRPSRTDVYNDIYQPVAALMRVLRDDGDGLARAVAMTPYSRSEYRASYPYPDGADDAELARLMAIRMQQSVGSLASRGSRSGWSRAIKQNSTTNSWTDFPSKFAAISERLQGVEIENRDALDVIRDYDSDGTLFYLDPPYVFSTRNPDWAYSDEMQDDSHAELADLVASLKGKVAVSGYASPLYDRLFPAGDGWTRHDGARKYVKPTPMADTGTRTESLWVNY